jgi:hypothetical protein
LVFCFCWGCCWRGFLFVSKRSEKRTKWSSRITSGRTSCLRIILYVLVVFTVFCLVVVIVICRVGHADIHFFLYLKRKVSRWVRADKETSRDVIN